ncbi:MAG: hypothetical protein WKF94_01015 [Solirubrobacteraceae bacterium]
MTGNLIRGTSAYAVHLYPDTHRSVIRGNAMLDNGGGVIVAGEGQMASSRNLIERNLIAGSGALGDLSSYWADASAAATWLATTA